MRERHRGIILLPHIKQQGRGMKIWVDADACPAAIKKILFRATERTKIQLTLVANQSMHIPPFPWIKMLKVASGFDVADKEIIKRLGIGDLVITADIPLAAEVIEKGCYALNPRGELYSSDNIQNRLNMRNFMDTLRSSGVDTGGPSALSRKNLNAFAGNLDKLLAKHKK